MNKTLDINLIDVKKFDRIDLNTIKLTFIFSYPGDPKYCEFFFNIHMYDMLLSVTKGGRITYITIKSVDISQDKLYVIVEFKIKGPFDFLPGKKTIKFNIDCKSKITAEKQNGIHTVTILSSFPTCYFESTFKRINCRIGC